LLVSTTTISSRPETISVTTEFVKTEKCHDEMERSADGICIKVQRPAASPIPDSKILLNANGSCSIGYELIDGKCILLDTHQYTESFSILPQTASVTVVPLQLDQTIVPNPKISLKVDGSCPVGHELIDGKCSLTGKTQSTLTSSVLPEITTVFVETTPVPTTTLKIGLTCPIGQEIIDGKCKLIEIHQSTETLSSTTITSSILPETTTVLIGTSLIPTTSLKTDISCPTGYELIDGKCTLLNTLQTTVSSSVQPETTTVLIQSTTIETKST